MLWGCPSVCACVRAAAGDDAFLDTLAVDFSLLKKGKLAHSRLPSVGSPS